MHGAAVCSRWEMFPSSTPADRPTRRRRKPLIEHQKADKTTRFLQPRTHFMFRRRPPFWRGLLWVYFLYRPRFPALILAAVVCQSVGPLCDRVGRFSAPQDGERSREGGGGDLLPACLLFHHSIHFSTITTLVIYSVVALIFIFSVIFSFLFVFHLLVFFTFLFSPRFSRYKCLNFTATGGQQSKFKYTAVI